MTQHARGVLPLPCATGDDSRKATGETSRVNASLETGAHSAIYGAGIIPRMPKEDGYNNLIPLNERAKDEQRKIRSKGGKARAEKARKARAVREVIEYIAAQPVTNDKLKKLTRGIAGEIDPEEIDMLTAATMGIFQAAIKGNVNAFEALATRLEVAQAEEDIPEDALSKSLRELGESL